MYKTKFRWNIDGLSNLNYDVVDIRFEALYVNITVKLFEMESRRNLSDICDWTS